MKLIIIFTLLILATLCVSLPRTNRDISPNKNYAVLASQIVATNLLKDNIDVEGNHVFSPLGISSVLAILAEGSKGDTYEEFRTALGFPEDKKELRSSFNSILKNFNAKDISTTPAFKTWFYIYRNNTAREEYKEILRDHYFTEVKDIDRSDYDWDISETLPETTTNSKDIINFEDLKKSEGFVMNENQPDVQKEASKFDKVVEDKQYVEVPIIKEEIAKQQEESNKDKDEKVDIKETELEVNEEENETIRDAEKLEVYKKEIDPIGPISNVESNEPEKITIPLKKLEDLEIMQALESHFVNKRFSGARSLFAKEDVASALSANALVGEEKPALTKMLLFNGLYYRGNWKVPFQQMRKGPEDVFYTSEKEVVPAIMMESRGKYRSASLEKLNSEAIEFPYEDVRYSLIVLLPNEREGLRKLIENLNSEDLSSIKTRLSEKIIDISLPKFNIESTGHSESVLQKLGLKKVFSSDADLSLINENDKLHVDEIVQHVNIRVDEGSSVKHVLTGSGQSRSADDGVEKSIIVDRPFLYFVMDNVEDFVVVAGKVTAPEFNDDVVF